MPLECIDEAPQLDTLRKKLRAAGRELGTVRHRHGQTTPAPARRRRDTLLTRGPDWRTEDLYRTARRLIHKTGRETPDDLWLAAADLCRVAEAHGLHQRVRMTPQRSHEIERLQRELHRVHETEVYQAAGSPVRDLAGDTSTVRRQVAIQALGYDDPPKQQPSGAIARALLRDAARRVQAAELGAERHTQYPAAKGHRRTDVV